MMLNRTAIFDRTVRNYDYEMTGSLWVGKELVGFRFGAWEPSGSKYDHYYDISVDSVNELGFMGVPETYYGMEAAPRVELANSEWGLISQEELEGKIEVVELTDPFVIAYMLKTYLFKGYVVYEGRNYISYGKRVVILHKAALFEGSFWVDATIYYGSAELDEVSPIVDKYSLEPDIVKDAIRRGDGSMSFPVEVAKLGEMIAAFGGVYTTAGIWHLCFHFLEGNRTLKGKDWVCFAPRTKNVLYTSIADDKHLDIWVDYIEALIDQLEGQEYVVL